jgi:hypothetical protein
MANQPGLASKVKGGSGARRNAHQPRRKPASHYGRDSGWAPELPQHQSLPERRACTTVMNMVCRAPPTRSGQARRLVDWL